MPNPVLLSPSAAVRLNQLLGRDTTPPPPARRRRKHRGATVDVANVTETIGPFVSDVTVASVVCNGDGTVTVTLSVTTKTQTLTITDGVLNITAPA